MSETSRRTILGTGLLAVGAAGIGVGVGVATGSPAHRSPAERTKAGQRGVDAPPAHNPVVVAAIERESTLLARLDRAVAANPSLAASATVLQADHRAHRQALQALLPPAGAAAGTSLPATTSSATTPASATSSGGTPSVALSSIVDLKRWESTAAAAAAHDCMTASAQLAPLLASISACEASHAAWLA